MRLRPRESRHRTARGTSSGATRAVGDAAGRRFDLDQRLQPEQAARAVAHQIDVEAAALGLTREGGGDLVGAHGEGGGIARHKDADAI